VHASRRALGERDTEALLESAQRLADRRTGHPESLARGAESLRLGDRDEHRHAIQVIGH
jgi:hypothetical protein